MECATQGSISDKFKVIRVRVLGALASVGFVTSLQTAFLVHVIRKQAAASGLNVPATATPSAPLVQVLLLVTRDVHPLNHIHPGPAQLQQLTQSHIVAAGYCFAIETGAL